MGLVQAFSLTLGLWDADAMFAPGLLSPRWRGWSCPSENASSRLGRVNLFPRQAPVVRGRKQMRLHPWGSTPRLRVVSEKLPAAEPPLPHPGRGSPCFLGSVAVQITRVVTLPACASALPPGTMSAAWETSRERSLSRRPQEAEPLLLGRLADLELLGGSGCLPWLGGGPACLCLGRDLTFGGEKPGTRPGGQGLPGNRNDRP